MATIEQSVVFVTHRLLKRDFDSSAWTPANPYLASLGAELLGEDEPHPFADFIVHEVAHIFHNCKRATIGLRETGTKVWLLNIEYRKRETFAYSCEAYARVLQHGKEPYGTASSCGGIRPRGADLRGTGGCSRSRQHHPGGSRPIPRSKQRFSVPIPNDEWQAKWLANFGQQHVLKTHGSPDPPHSLVRAKTTIPAAPVVGNRDRLERYNRDKRVYG